MNIGDQLRVHLVERLSEAKAKVLDLESGDSGILLIKGELRVRRDRTINAWVIQCDRKNNTFVCGNAFFGKFSISASLGQHYVRIIKSLYDNPTELVADDISCLKGMCNRCLKKDQWDWFTTYKYLGYPSLPFLRSFVDDAVVQRDLLRQGSFDGLDAFRKDYHFLLSNILFHLSEHVDVAEECIDVPLPGFARELWGRLAPESRKNLKLVERFHSKASSYLLMHYFVTLEQEFRSHFIAPFQKTFSNELALMECTSERHQRTHEVLTGRGHFTLGGIGFLGGFLNSKRAIRDSAAVKKFADYLGVRKLEFSELCKLVSETKVGDFLLPDLRNGLAHGHARVTCCVDRSHFESLRSILLEPPCALLPRILANSLHFDSSPALSTSTFESGSDSHV